MPPSTLPELRRERSEQLSISPAETPTVETQAEKDLEVKRDDVDEDGAEEPIPWAVKWISLIAVMAMPIGKSDSDIAAPSRGQWPSAAYARC
jgi:hypothetical protein